MVVMVRGSPVTKLITTNSKCVGIKFSWQTPTVSILKYLSHLKLSSNSGDCSHSCPARFTCPGEGCNCMPNSYCDDVNLFCDQMHCDVGQVGTCISNKCTCVQEDYCKYINLHSNWRVMQSTMRSACEFQRKNIFLD